MASKGREVIRFGELLSSMHDSFDGFEVVTKMVQAADESNGGMFIFEATVKVHRGDRTFIYTGYGDAAKWNVSKNIAPSICRMAETRAIVRAFKLATNVGTVTAEELPGDSDEPAPYRAPASAETPAPSPASRKKDEVEEEDGEEEAVASTAQLKYLKRLADDLGIGLEAVNEEFGNVARMSPREASEVIETLNRRRREKTG